MQNANTKGKLKSGTNIFPRENPSFFPPKPSKPTSTLGSKQSYQSGNSNIPLCQSLKLNKFVGKLSTRSSGKIMFSRPEWEFRSNKTSPETIENTVKQNLKSLTYREKLLNIEALLKNCRQLCQQYGYFYITCAMLFYDPFTEIKLSAWIHPDTRIIKCLHPIMKRTEYEKEVEFIQNLKIILRAIFPTIPLGNGKTFTSFLIHIQEIKAKMFNKNKLAKPNFFSPIQNLQNLQKTQKKITLRQETSDCLQTRKHICLDAHQEKLHSEEEQQKKNENNILYEDKTVYASKIGLQDFGKLFEEEVETSKQTTGKIQDELNRLFGSTDFCNELYFDEAMKKKSLIERMSNELNNFF